MKIWPFPFIAAALLLAGCSNEEQKAQEEGEHVHIEMGDISETTKNADTLPAFLNSQSEQIQQVYSLAGHNHELLQWIPCYCGCGESVGHQSNENCFVREVKETGEIVWDSHATKCVNCLEIATIAVSLQQQGKSVLEIRNYIDNKYKEGYAKPTPTPMPS